MKKTYNKSLNIGGNAVFNGNVNMETQTIFFKNGKIVTTPCDFELGQFIVANGKSNVTQRGSMRTDDDGNSTFRPYNTDTGSPFVEIFPTAHGSVREYKNCIVVKHTFPKKLGKALIEALYCEETEDIKAFIKTRKSETLWQ